jgi:hypothetical protein
MKHNRVVALLLAALSLCSVSSQELWTTADIDISLAKKLKADVEVECRTTDQIYNVSRLSMSMGLSYRLLKYLKIGVIYAFIYDHNGNEYDDDDVYTPYYWQPRQRLQGFLTGNYRVGRWSFLLRELYQYTYHRERITTVSFDFLTNEWALAQTIDTKHRGYLRSKVGVEYNIRKCPFTPFASCELYHDVSDFAMSKVRYTIGSDYKLNSHNSLQLFYRYIDDKDHTHVIGVGYTFKLK